tara:strand:- start:332 stop:544 length:213 start_codon:yes stop_codon:yes gene_type:complete
MSLTFSAQQNTLDTTTGDNMKTGDLARNIYDGEIYIIMSKVFLGYYDVCDTQGREWSMPEEHLEVVDAER